jgi:predicted dinucleotide-binding enzyme
MRGAGAGNHCREPAVAAAVTTVGFIGSGRIGSTLARLSVAAGYRVLLSNSRGPETLRELALELGPLATGATGEQAASASDLVVLTIPLRAYLSVPAAPLAGQVVIDTCNYYPQRDGHIAELDDHSVTSSELIQRRLADATVVKAFQNIFFRHLLSLSRPAGSADRSYLPIAGDDPAAKATVTAYLDSIGYGAVDAGSLADSWRVEPGMHVYGPPSPYGPLTDEAGAPAGEAQIRAAIAAASR